jgi:iron complex transport system ATP-binding protein
MRVPAGPAILYVTHHVEEIIPTFTHALLLKQGRVVDYGRIGECLTAGNLGKVFGRRVVLKKSGGRFGLRLAKGGAPNPHPVGRRTSVAGRKNRKGY